MPAPGKRSGILRGFLGLSLLLHANLALLMVAFLSLNPDGCSVAPLPLEPFEISLVPTAELPRPRPEQERVREELKKEEEKQREEEKQLRGQVVDIPRPAEEQRPDSARFLSEYDAKVARETKAPPRPYKPGSVVPSRPVPTPPAPQPTPREQQRLERKLMKLAMRAQPAIPRSELQRSEAGEQHAPLERRPRPAVEGAAEQQAQEEQRPRRLTLGDLRLDEQELMRAMGTRVNDYLKDVEDGEQTLLNSRRWRFASFFNRVKRQVAQNWHPDRVYRRRDPTGNVYGFRDRLTVLRVQLSPTGTLEDVFLERASGVGFLDDEAISAFRAASPFPNPPTGLVDRETGQISFRFGFMFEISRKPSLRLFRGD